LLKLLWLDCSCGQQMKVDAEALGSQRKCVRCGQRITVDESNTRPMRPSGPQPMPDIDPAPGNDNLPGVNRSETPVEVTGPPAHTPDGVTPTAASRRASTRPAVPRAQPAPQEKPKIGELLVNENLVTQGQLDKALDRQKKHGGKMVENLIALQFLDPRTFLNFLSRQPGMASIDLLNYTIPQEVIELVPADFALKHEILPIDKMGRHLTVGMACPLDSRTVNELVEMTGMKIRPLLVSMNDIRVALKRYYAPKEQQTFSLRANFGAMVGDMSEAEAAAGATAEPELAAAAPVEVPEILMPQIALPKVESALTFESVVHLVREVSALPALPETVVNVKKAMENPSTSTGDVAEIIRRDPSLAAKVISLANSAAYGVAHRVDSVELATTLLGLREIYAVVLSSAVIDYFEKSRHFDYQAFWKRSLFCGTAAKIIARACDSKDVSGVFAAGLLHDIGRVVFAEVVPARYAELSQTIPDGELIAQENKLFGVAHPEVGYILAKNWMLPLEITEPIRFHHEFAQAQEAKKLVTIIYLAALLTDSYGRITRDNVREFAADCKEALDVLGLSEQQFIRVLAETAAAVKAEMR
jgi:HD-like signal output (HDOD) protein